MDTRARSKIAGIGVFRVAGVPVLGGLVVGGLTSWLQSGLPDQVQSFANSSGGWSMMVFVLVWASRGTPVVSAFFGLACFLTMLEGYDLVTTWRGFGYVAPFGGPFWYLALVAGPVLGACAALTRHGSGAWPVLAVAPLSGVLVGEGIWSLGNVADTTSPFYWWMQIALGVAFLGVALVRRRPSVAVIVAVTLVTALAAAAFIVVYNAAAGQAFDSDPRIEQRMTRP